MAKVPHGVEILPKISIAWVGRTNVTDDRQTTDRQTTDRRQTDGPSMTYSEHELEFTFAKNCHIRLPLLCLTPPTDGFPWDDLGKIFIQSSWMAKVPHGVEILPKISIVWVGRTNVTDDRRQTYRQTTDWQTTDGPSMTNSEHKLEFTFAKNYRIGKRRTNSNIATLLMLHFLSCDLSIFLFSIFTRAGDISAFVRGRKWGHSSEFCLCLNLWMKTGKLASTLPVL